MTEDAVTHLDARYFPMIWYVFYLFSRSISYIIHHRILQLIHRNSVSAIFAAMTAEFSQLHSLDLAELERNAHLRMVKYKVLALKEFAKCHVLAGWIRELFLGLLDRQSDETAADEKSQQVRTQQPPDLQRVLASSETQNLVANRPGLSITSGSATVSLSKTSENQLPSEISFSQQGSAVEVTPSLPNIDLSGDYKWGLGQELGYLTSERSLDSDISMDKLPVGWPEFSNFGDGSGIDELYRHYCNQ